jgi:2-keto-3-deoxy-L-rhamnonate aldolase RhmA
MHPGLHFKQRLREGKTLLGAWCALDSPATLEAMSHLDLDWLMVDCEHGLTSAENCLVQIQAADRHEKTVFVRVPRLDPGLIGRVLDAGAHGVMVPKVNSAEQAAAVVEACRYPPAGQRGIGPHRSSAYFTQVADALERSNGRLVIAIQIESREAVDAIDEILEVPGIDVVFVGPADLSASLGHFGDPGHAEVEEAAQKVLDRALERGVGAGYYCNSGKAAALRAKQGFQMVNVGNDFGLLVRAVSEQASVARAALLEG